jgi:hypothetical protein
MEAKHFEFRLSVREEAVAITEIQFFLNKLVEIHNALDMPNGNGIENKRIEANCRSQGCNSYHSNLQSFHRFDEQIGIKLQQLYV